MHYENLQVESGVEGIIATICDCWNYNYGIFRRDKTIERIRTLAAERDEALSNLRRMAQKQTKPNH